MKNRFWIGWAAALAMAPTPALAEQAPIPMPRPADRMPEPAAPAAVPVPPTVEATTATEAIAAVAARQPVTLTARITEDGGSIADGVVWRIFETRTDADGELALAAKSDQATAHLQLVPGKYVVHVAYGRAQASDTFDVVEGQNNKAIVLDAGGMRLNAAVSGDIDIPLNLLRFDVFTSDDESDRALVAQQLAANDLVTLNAGTYHVVSYFGDVNAVVRADLRVEPGQLTEATLYHRAAQTSFKLVTEPGGEAIADVEWTVKTAGGATIFSDIGAFPATVLAEGDYLVLAKQGDAVYNREFEVKAGPGREIEVLTTVY